MFAILDTYLFHSCLYHALTPFKLLVFDDLRQLGYNIVRNRALTLSEIKASYRKLAKWHAASYKLANEYHYSVFVHI